MEKKELLLNLAFFAITLPIVLIIFVEYANQSSEIGNINYANPLNLIIKNVFVYDNGLEIIVYNPNNYTVQFTSNIIGVRNSFGSVGPITQGGDLGTVKSLPPKSSITFFAPLLIGTKPKLVVDQWKSAGGNLTIVLYYTSLNGISGVVSITIKR